MKANQLKTSRGFTLVELLAVVAVVFLLAATLLPGLANTKVGSQVFRCQNNLKQLTRAWLMYADENHDQLMPPGSWVGSSTMEWAAGTGSTNTSPLLDNLIGNYVKASSLFKCPADRYQSAANPGPRVRSIALNGVLGGSGSNPQGGGVSGDRVYYGKAGDLAHSVGRGAMKMAELIKPGPANVFVMLDEQADSINDADFVSDPGYTGAATRWRDLPASYHNGAGSFSFADGHVEIHKWLNENKNGPSQWAIPLVTTTAVSDPGNWRLNPHSSKDYQWVDDRMPYR